MHDHLNQHQLRHQELIKTAEHQRLVTKLRQTNTNPIAIKLGEMLIATGEQLQRNTHEKRQLAKQ